MEDNTDKKALVDENNGENKVPKKKNLSRLIVEEATNDDNSVVALNTKRMEELNFFRGDTIIIKGKKRHSTICIILNDNDLDEGKIRINKVARKNLRVCLGGNNINDENIVNLYIK